MQTKTRPKQIINLFRHLIIIIKNITNIIILQKIQNRIKKINTLHITKTL